MGLGRGAKFGGAGLWEMCAHIAIPAAFLGPGSGFARREARARARRCRELGRPAPGRHPPGRDPSACRRGRAVADPPGGLRLRNARDLASRPDARGASQLWHGRAIGLRGRHRAVGTDRRTHHCGGCAPARPPSSAHRAVRPSHELAAGEPCWSWRTCHSAKRTWTVPSRLAPIATGSYLSGAAARRRICRSKTRSVIRRAIDKNSGSCPPVIPFTPSNVSRRQWR